MQTQIDASHGRTASGRRAEAILRSCVHCGFCNANCPTYRLLGDELDGPRGRIYLIKQVFEGQPPGPSTRRHLDRCLYCRACETTCPSGVAYGELLELGREEVERRLRRPWHERLLRLLLRKSLLNAPRMGWAWRRLALLRRLVPGRWRPLIPVPAPVSASQGWPVRRHERTMLVLDGCVQAAVHAEINLTAARVLDRLGISLLPVSGCCGAVSQHLGAPTEARTIMRDNLGRWQEAFEAGAEAIVTTSSACSLMIRDYDRLLAGYEGQNGLRLAGRNRDIVEIMAGEDLSRWCVDDDSLPAIVFHPPCTLQHGMRLAGVIEDILGQLGYRLLPFDDANQCCGAAGTYSLQQPRIARALQQRKIAALTAPSPALIATANIGCQLHLEGEAGRPVVHWLTLVEQAMQVAEAGS